jgi:3-oxoacyl-[acyl-carrier-protein] synthase II
MQQKRATVVVTGMGAVTPLGIGCTTFWQGLSGNRSAIRQIERFTVPKGVPALGATIPDEYLPTIQHAYANNFCAWSMQQVLTDLCVNVGYTAMGLSQLGRGAIFFSTHFDGDSYDQTLREGGVLTVTSTSTWSLDRWAVWLQEQTGAETATCILTTCTGANTAIGLATDWLALDLCDWALAGGMEMIHPEYLLEQDCLRALSSTGCHPFARDRDGTVMGEGAGLLLLERAENAQQRQASIYATIAGYSLYSDNTDLTRVAADGHTIRHAMQQALEAADVSTEEIGYINAAATGSPALDDAELVALRSLFPSLPPVSTIKAQIGHGIGVSGALETIATIMALQEQFLPPTLGSDPQVLGFDSVPIARPQRLMVALNNAVSMSGHICSTVLKRGLA